jgi:hypothetical protein
MQGVSESAARHAGLTNREAVGLAAWGVLLWFVFAMIIRFAASFWFDGGWPTVLLFVASLPLAAMMVGSTRRMFGISGACLVAGVSIANAAALLCDGIAFTWTGIYGSGRPELLVASAWLLWGVGMVTLAAVWAGRPRRHVA